ncbi:MAG: 5-(carboxyamino)imidazole ribonucleotide synthase, partial [Planctomycetes bacterium]|nr:5-(carboxyamino)imidazole ribonucleotide synthase [Planctomycetota bacterium]
LPGATLGVLGSGQLGRMFALAARRMGYRVKVLSPDQDTPTGQVADVEITAAYDDLDAVASFARDVAVVTFEFENVPAATAETAARFAPVRPDYRVLHTTQHRIREKSTLAEAGFAVTPFRAVQNQPELATALDDLGRPAVLKSAAWGYDGKGQIRINDRDDDAEAWRRLGVSEAVLEAFIPFEQELSVVAARSLDGSTAHYGPIGNTHRNHILDLSVYPADVPPDVAREAVEIARSVMETLDVVGVLCVEFFLTGEGKLLINELAPRPHNSGHLTIDACVTCQFEQQVRAVCGLPLGADRLLSPAAMANLLGDLWSDGEPNWPAALADRDVKLHLYEKRQPLPGRKMGHLTVLAATPKEATERALAARAALLPRPT